MADPSPASKPPPPPTKSGAGMYLLFALLLLGGAVGLYFVTKKDPPPPVVQTAAPAPTPEVVMNTPAPPPPPKEEDLVEEDAGSDAGSGKKVSSGGGGGSCAKCGEGKISPALSSAIRNAAGAAQGCYRRALRQSAASGSMTVSVQVGSSGNVCGASIVNDSVGSPEISNCVLGRFRGNNFPPPEQGCVVVNVPINFKIAE